MEEILNRNLIVAVAANGCIGVDGGMPWHCSEDLRRFKKLTTGHTIIMGRKTFESIGKKPLPNRTNLVVTRDWSAKNSILRIQGKGLFFCKDYRTAITHRGASKKFIIGGAQMYEIALQDQLFSIEQIYLTLMKNDYDGDTFFPEWPLSDEWTEINREQGKEDDNVEYITYRRTKTV